MTRGPPATPLIAERVLDRGGVELIGAGVAAIEAGEDVARMRQGPPRHMWAMVA